MKKEKKKIIWTNGCFDILHIGHIRYLEKAKLYGDILIVGLNDDESVRKLKGEKRPIINEKERAEILSALEFIDYIVFFHETDVTKYLKALEPDVYVKGGDYTMETINQDERKIVEDYSGRIIIIPAETSNSTTNIIEKIKDS
ncbi:D-glycero-beta-D-manno-heptose 1-phosphate adenylyltransferase [Candidatus Pacearchaeota archaeon]|nr:D-glycero-beta-D-manno-heptose 1-phosphate adenylyltransferase [Candidatus Pacearchaeota archaeon]